MSLSSGSTAGRHQQHAAAPGEAAGRIPTSASRHWLALSNDSILWKCLAGGIGCGLSGFVTNPMDVIKIRNQQFGGAKYSRFTGTALVIWQEEGGRGFFKGASASVLRELTYSSLRMGLYEPIKESVVRATEASDPTSPAIKWTAAFCSGAIGSAIFNPIDLIKVRFQSHLPHEPPPYRSIPHAAASIYRQEGGAIKGLYNGVGPTVIRAAMLTSAQLGSYDVIKNNLLVDRWGFDKEHGSTHFVSSMLASVVTTTAANPADVIKTRVMNDKTTSSGGNNNKAWKHTTAILRREGAGAFMKGWTASYLRIGPHTVISLVLIEVVRKMLGMETY